MTGQAYNQVDAETVDCCEPMEYQNTQACMVQQRSNIMIKLHLLMVAFIGGKNRLASELMSAL